MDEGLVDAVVLGTEQQFADRSDPITLSDAGLALLDRMSSDDPTALIGLPLIALSAALRELGYKAP